MKISVEMVVFDMDDTLSATKSRITSRTAHLLGELLNECRVCIISGSRIEQFELQVLDALIGGDENLNSLHLMPTCGARYYTWAPDGSWAMQYSLDLSEPERSLAKQVLTEAAQELGYWEPKIWGDRIEDRGTQVTFSALGQTAPPELKAEWDRSGEKKAKLRAAVSGRLPHLEVRSGGTTSIDITKKDIDKAFGVRRLLRATALPPEQVLFVGDSFEPHGNDYPVRATGINCIAVKSHGQTADLIEELVRRLGGDEGRPRQVSTDGLPGTFLSADA